MVRVSWVRAGRISRSASAEPCFAEATFSNIKFLTRTNHSFCPVMPQKTYSLDALRGMFTHRFFYRAKKISYKANRAGIAERFEHPSTRASIKLDLDLLQHYDESLRKLSFRELRGDCGGPIVVRRWARPIAARRWPRPVAAIMPWRSTTTSSTIDSARLRSSKETRGFPFISRIESPLLKPIS